MKITLLHLLFLFCFQSLLSAQEKRLEQLKEAYSLVMTAKIGLQKVGKVHPQLKAEVTAIQAELEKSKIEKAFQGLLTELKETLGDDFPRFEKETSESIAANEQLVPKELEATKAMVGNIAMVKDGRLPTNELRTLVSCHPAYQKEPLQEMKDGFVAGYSTKLDPEKRDVHFLMRYPGSWKPVANNDPSLLFTADSKAGFGDARLALNVTKSPFLTGPQIKELDQVMVATNLIPKNSKVIEKGKATVAGLPAGRVLLSFTPKGADKPNRIIAYSGQLKGYYVSVKISILNNPATTFEKQIAKYDPLLKSIAENLEITE